MKRGRGKVERNMEGGGGGGGGKRKKINDHQGNQFPPTSVKKYDFPRNINQHSAQQYVKLRKTAGASCFPRIIAYSVNASLINRIYDTRDYVIELRGFDENLQFFISSR